MLRDLRLRFSPVSLTAVWLGDFEKSGHISRPLSSYGSKNYGQKTTNESFTLTQKPSKSQMRYDMSMTAVFLNTSHQHLIRHQTEILIRPFDMKLYQTQTLTGHQFHFISIALALLQSSFTETFEHFREISNTEVLFKISRHHNTNNNEPIYINPYKEMLFTS